LATRAAFAVDQVIGTLAGALNCKQQRNSNISCHREDISATTTKTRWLHLVAHQQLALAPDALAHASGPLELALCLASGNGPSAVSSMLRSGWGGQTRTDNVLVGLLGADLLLECGSDVAGSGRACLVLSNVIIHKSTRRKNRFAALQTLIFRKKIHVGHDMIDTHLVGVEALASAFSERWRLLGRSVIAV